MARKGKGKADIQTIWVYRKPEAASGQEEGVLSSLSDETVWRRLAELLLRGGRTG
ncbi:hypothetical protein [Gorillibacterium sp. sgz5001074]|uniref:hypothetical protein n=1 Tax=Gorillibacterium sp. sgz5001074 TaxID=3446695 RepID=UPI003F66EA4B